MRRGDIVTVAGGVYASKPRPALIVQDDRFDATNSLTVCPFTSAQVDAPLLRVPVTADEVNGLDQDSLQRRQQERGRGRLYAESSDHDSISSALRVVSAPTGRSFCWVGARPATSFYQSLLIATRGDIIAFSS